MWGRGGTETLRLSLEMKLGLAAGGVLGLRPLLPSARCGRKMPLEYLRAAAIKVRSSEAKMKLDVEINYGENT